MITFMVATASSRFCLLCVDNIHPDARRSDFYDADGT